MNPSDPVDHDPVDRIPPAGNEIVAWGNFKVKSDAGQCMFLAALSGVMDKPRPSII